MHPIFAHFREWPSAQKAHLIGAILDGCERLDPTGQMTRGTWQQGQTVKLGMKLLLSGRPVEFQAQLWIDKASSTLQRALINAITHQTLAFEIGQAETKSGVRNMAWIAPLGSASVAVMDSADGILVLVGDGESSRFWWSALRFL